jgi:hypothetical protein
MAKSNRNALAGAIGMITAMTAYAAPVWAEPIPDPTGDVIPRYAGPHDPDLDVTSVSAIYDSSHALFTLSAAGLVATGAIRRRRRLTAPTIGPDEGLG